MKLPISNLLLKSPPAAQLLCPGVHHHLGYRWCLPAGTRLREAAGPSGQLLTHPLFYLAVYAPTTASLVLTALFGGTAGLRKLLGRLLPWRAGVQWYLVVLLGYPLVGLLAGRAAGLFGVAQGQIPDWGHFLWALMQALVVDPGPLGEELGWRGFALPRMLARWRPLKASLILGLIWGIWHLPAFLIVGLPQNRLALPRFPSRHYVRVGD